MQKFRELLFAIFSILIPLAVYIVVFLIEGIPADRIAGSRTYVALVASNAVGFALAVPALASSKNPIDASPGVLIAILLGSISVLANLFVAEFMLYAR